MPPNTQAGDSRKLYCSHQLLVCHTVPRVIGRFCLALIETTRQSVRRAANASTASINASYRRGVGLPGISPNGLDSAPTHPHGSAPKPASNEFLQLDWILHGRSTQPKVGLAGGRDICQLAAGTAVGEIDLPQFAVCLPAGGWTNRRGLALRPTAGGEGDLCSSAITLTTTRSWPSKSNSECPRDTYEGRDMIQVGRAVRDSGRQHLRWMRGLR